MLDFKTQSQIVDATASVMRWYVTAAINTSAASTCRGLSLWSELLDAAAPRNASARQNRGAGIGVSISPSHADGMETPLGTYGAMAVAHGQHPQHEPAGAGVVARIATRPCGVRSPAGRRGAGPRFQPGTDGWRRRRRPRLPVRCPMARPSALTTAATPATDPPAATRRRRSSWVRHKPTAEPRRRSGPDAELRHRTARAICDLLESAGVR